MKKNIWITGSSGFIGTALVKHWRETRPDIELVLLVRKAGEPASGIRYVTPHQADFSFDELKQLRDSSPPDLIIHLATRFQNAYTPADADLMNYANIRFPNRILEAVRDMKEVAFLNFGTFYSHANPAITDSPATFYAASKTAFESILSFYFAKNGWRAMTLKLYDTYGPNDSRAKLIPKWIEISRSGEKMKVSPGDQKLNLVHVKDIIRAVEIAEEILAQKSYAGHATFQLPAHENPEKLPTLKEAAAMFEKASGKSLPIEFGGLPYRENEIMQPSLPYPVLPGWKPSVELEAGFRGILKS